MSHFSPGHSPEFRMHYEVYEGLLPRDTLFIHGNLASNKWWYPSLEELRSGKSTADRGGRAILAEWRGCGESSAPESIEQVDVELFARDYLALADELKLAEFDIVGHSTGGIVALMIAAQKPERVRSLFLLDSVGAQGVVFAAGMYEAFEQMKKSAELTAQVIGSTIYQHNPEDAFFREVIAPDAHRAVQAVGAWVIQSLASFDATDKIRGMKQAAYVVHGAHDQTLPVEDSKSLSELLPNSQFKVWDEAGHCPNLEQPKYFAKEVLRFFESIG